MDPRMIFCLRGQMIFRDKSSFATRTAYGLRHPHRTDRIRKLLNPQYIRFFTGLRAHLRAIFRVPWEFSYVFKRRPTSVAGEFSHFSYRRISYIAPYLPWVRRYAVTKMTQPDHQHRVTSQNLRTAEYYHRRERIRKLG
jgi:hypothetical protein